MIIKLKNVRIHWCKFLFNAGVYEKGAETSEADFKKNARFSSTFIINKSDPQIKVIQEAMLKAAIDRWSEKGPSTFKQIQVKNNLCLHDGEEKAEYAGFEDVVYINTRDKKKPFVIDRGKHVLQESDEVIYPGCYVNAIIDIWAMDNQFGKRICAKPKGVQFFKDGEPLDNEVRVSEDDFEDLSDLGDDSIF